MAAGGVVPALLFVTYKYGLRDRLGWPEMPELEAVLPGLAVVILTWFHHRANAAREHRDRKFLLSLVGAGVVVPVPPNPYVREPVAVPITPAQTVLPP